MKCITCLQDACPTQHKLERKITKINNKKLNKYDYEHRVLKPGLESVNSV